MRFESRLPFLLVVSVTLGVGPAAAQDEAISRTEMEYLADTALESAVVPTGPEVGGSPDWGIADFTWRVVPAADCTESENQEYVSAFGWYRGNATGSYRYWDCPMEFPSGSLVYSMGAEVDDSDATNYVGLYVRRYDFLGSTYTTLVSETTSVAGTPGKHYHGPFNPGFTIDNQIYNYTARVRTGNSGLTQFRCLYFGLQLQISPAPGVATFNDVPVGSFGFQHIEALAASGITAGCGGGAFCPNNTLTRAEMAIFLAKALGLHWGH